MATKSAVDLFHGCCTYEHRLPAALYEMHETEEQASIYSLQMAKKWIDDRG